VEPERVNKIYDVATLAAHWGCGADTVYTLVRSGELAHFKLGGKLIRIRADEVERYECRTITPCNDTEASSQSRGSPMVSATDARLERLIAHQPRQRPGASGKDA